MELKKKAIREFAKIIKEPYTKIYVNGERILVYRATQMGYKLAVEIDTELPIDNSFYDKRRTK